MNFMDVRDEPLYSVGEVAQKLKVTIRSLHHWESMGLIAPSERSWSNYRLYTARDCERIQQIIVYRATGMKLTEIKALLDTDSSPREHLQRQREALVEQQSRLADMLQAIDKLLEAEMSQHTLDLDQIGQILGDARFAEHQAEAEEKYGETDDWRISQRRTASWNAEDWAANKQRFEAIDAQLAAAVRAGLPSDSDEATALVAAHRAVLSEFFPVTPAKHYLISRGYIADERFRSYYENQQVGLAQWLADAIAHVARESGVDLDNPGWE